MKRINPSYYNLLILVSLLFITINQTGCWKKSDEITPINKRFVTKKKTFLYEDVHARNVIAEIPEFTTLKAKRKMTVQRSAGMVAVYYDVQFNKQHGWAMAIYLVEVSDDEQPGDSRKRKSPKNASNKKLRTPRSNKMKPKITERTQNSVQSSRKTDSDHGEMRKKVPVEKTQKSNSDGVASLSNAHQLFSVQVGSFKDSVYALDLVNNIRLLGFDTQLNEFYGNSGLWWRVRIGKYNSRGKANKTANIIRRAYPLEPWVVSIIGAPYPEQHQDITEEETGIKTEYYTIQISSVKNRNNATLLADRLNNAGYPSIVTSVDVKGEIWYRVRHGEYKMITVAKRVATELENKYKLSPWISNIYK